MSHHRSLGPLPSMLAFATLALTGCTVSAGEAATGADGIAGPLKPPAEGRILVAVALGPGATVIDFAGPWEVFQDVMLPERGPRHEDQHPFELVTVAATRDAVAGSFGLRVLPDRTFDEVPDPKVIVVPAMQPSDELFDWLREVTPRADVTMSVCTGAFILARAGLLDGLRATTHHDFLDAFGGRFPAVRLERGRRWVEGSEGIATAGGLTSGIDLALRVVERYFGSAVAERTATFMEHASEGWRGAGGGIAR